MKLELGKRYVLHGGRITGPMRPHGSKPHLFVADAAYGNSVRGWDWHRETGLFDGYQDTSEYPMHVLHEYVEPSPNALKLGTRVRVYGGGQKITGVVLSRLPKDVYDVEVRSGTTVFVITAHRNQIRVLKKKPRFGCWIDVSAIRRMGPEIGVSFTETPPYKDGWIWVEERKKK